MIYLTCYPPVAHGMIHISTDDQRTVCAKRIRGAWGHGQHRLDSRDAAIEAATCNQCVRILRLSR